MPHPDAVGYLSDLAKEIHVPWFGMICDLAAGGASDLTHQDVEVLFAIFIGKASYVQPVGAPSGAAPPSAGGPADFLEMLAGFSNFKLIGEAFHMDLKKRITLVFGANGSGKSSLCESLRVLASPETPTRPLQNVRSDSKIASTFKFKFRSDTGAIKWLPTVGYGAKQATIKYFDTAIAAKNIKRAVDPSRIIEVAPFKLYLFERTAALTSRFREALQERQRDNSEALAEALEIIRGDFKDFEGRPLATVNEKTLDLLDEAINTGDTFAAVDDLAAKRAAAAEMEKATSEDGLKLLKSEERELSTLLDSLSGLTKLATDLQQLDPVAKAKTVAAKQEAQEVLAGALVPSGATLDAVIALAKAAAPLCHLDAAMGESCPLCRRELGDAEARLFRQYSDLVIGELERDIAVLKADHAKAESLVERLGQTIVADWEKNVTIAPEFLTEAIRLGGDIIRGCSMTVGVAPSALVALDDIAALIATWDRVLDAKTKAIEAASSGRIELLAKLAVLRKEIEPLAYAEAIQKFSMHIKNTRRLAKRSAFFATELPNFQALLKRITNASKKAHEDLIVADFEARLNAEYQSLTERDMATFGVTLTRRGADATVSVLPQVGGKDIEGVLSEGEQRVHALALFFAELETCPQSVIVFDDPVSSFDYNFIGNYCVRLRDFAKAHPERQVIVLTHNWEFFVHLQTMLNTAKLSNDMSVQVLENCSTVDEYSEDVTALKTEIEAILGKAGEPSRFEKEGMAGNMRVLIEAIVNTHVFAKQRHQYKQKSQPASNFDDYTKLVPLLPAEAVALRDLYAKLSVSEHHDPRNAYVNTDKAMFHSRYDEITSIEAAIVSRK
ncbi:AAA family ATPase [Burkholderia gladioli]|uniref:AAA family ATPase n=1 Tax=Burkholderia gladioli TaxID=28095 RepID=UPI001C5CF880|nr:AAA family ATPase [Burkholderia gladioli]MBW5286786.1 AAA family ATPase [Burkholderia gladioli]